MSKLVELMSVEKVSDWLSECSEQSHSLVMKIEILMCVVRVTSKSKVMGDDL